MTYCSLQGNSIYHLSLDGYFKSFILPCHAISYFFKLNIWVEHLVCRLHPLQLLDIIFLLCIVTEKKMILKCLIKYVRQYNYIPCKRSEKFLPCRKNQHIRDLILECIKRFLHSLHSHKIKQILTAAAIQLVEYLFLVRFILIPQSCSKIVLFTFSDIAAGLWICSVAFISLHWYVWYISLPILSVHGLHSEFRITES